SWELVLGHLPEVGIKYDPSHCVYDGGDYLQETRDWGKRFYHIHLKGSLQIDGQRYDDPPAGMDQTNWGAFMAVLYAQGYSGGLSIEPHSPTWEGELLERGLDYTVKYFKRLLFR
ncbi:MAG: sugar phosphate isomerase/epimerase, partial [Limnochordia bacterium]